MNKRAEFLESIVSTISDYRKGELPAPSPEHVDKWVKQFSQETQIPVLTEMAHILSRSYISRSSFQEFLENALSSPKLTGGEPAKFWKKIKFLDIQGGGNSQHEMLQMFDSVMSKKIGLKTAECGEAPEAYMYLDDGIFSGNRVRRDLTKWLATKEAPTEGKVYVVAMAAHTNGVHYANSKIVEDAKRLGKKITLEWWRLITAEDQKANTDTSDVLRPGVVPNDDLVKKYVEDLTKAGFPPVLRKGGNLGARNFFSSSASREMIESELLLAGCRIRDKARQLPENARPLGYSVLKTLGFGNVIVTFRNCPNNCPLAFWAGNPWHPLFARKIN